MGGIDLHVHTTASDGAHPPRQVVEMAARLGLRAIAIADHDTTAGAEEAQEAAASWAVEAIAAVEINAEFAHTELHVLGYHVRLASERLQSVLGQLREGRLQRARAMVNRLTAMGLPLDWGRVMEIAGEGSSVGRPHVAQALVERGYAVSTADAFARYIGKGRPAHIERFKLAPAQAIALIREAGGVAVLAHPLQLMDVVPELVGAGLAGLEAYYPGYSARETGFLLDLAARYGLLVTGGSDFHGGGVLPESRLGGVEVPAGVLEALRHRALERAA